jgi:hypothetical protein
MAKCRSCGVELALLNRGQHGYCKKCDHEGKGEGINNPVKSAVIEAILLTTETASNLNITKRIEIVTAECAFGMRSTAILKASGLNVAV